MHKIPNDIEVRRIIKFLNRNGLLDKKFSSNKNYCEITEKELRSSSKHDLSLNFVYNSLKFLLEHFGYKDFNNGLSKNEKKIKIEGKAYETAKQAYNFFKD
ncbi:MAG: hypothetical protein QXD43_03165 [Candidatus Aenigmatarchaeota archaeon]